MKTQGRFFTTKNIVSLGLLIAATVALQAISIIIPTPVNMNLSLIPITIAAILYGPIAGGIIGLVSGVMVLVSPNTVTMFMAISPVATVFACLTKTMIAGVVAGLVAKLCYHFDKKILGAVLASILVPVVNTGIFVIFCLCWFMEGLGLTSFGMIFTALIGVNFLIEVVMNVVICPTLNNVLQHVKHN